MKTKYSCEKVAIVGPFPPPITGQSKNTEKISCDISDMNNVLNIDTARDPDTFSGFSHITKFFRVIQGALHLVYCSRSIKSVYISLDTKNGLVYNLLFVIIGQILKLPTFLHHRSFEYISDWSIVMKAICTLGKHNCEHIFLCERMKKNFFFQYGHITSTVLSNASALPDRQYKEELPFLKNGTLTIGFLSNLIMEKGVDTVIRVHQKCLTQENIYLHIAGDAFSENAKELVESHARNHPDTVKYFGALSRSEIPDFINGIDVLVFPTRYKTEAQPNVVLECLAQGRPVIATKRACLTSDITQDVGYTFDENYNLEKNITSAILNLSTRSDLLETFSINAACHIRQQRNFYLCVYRDLISRITK